jgi:sigma-54 dependent transcriptional regulator, acetoin dehydrogenase operon transcriptional activator AcoR
VTPRPSQPSAPDVAGLAETRERFLTADSVAPSGVRDAILASWWRSRESNVAADHVELQYHRDPDLDTPLTRSAEPVLQHLREQLDGQALSIVLTDPAGIVLTRLTPDAALERHLDKVLLAPGFNYAERFVGTNGIGTALEAGESMYVFGHEHYAENLEDLACAAVPIRHPISGKTVGALDLTCWRKDAGPLLITLAKTTAEQIRQALLTETGMREIELLHAYLRACGRSTGMVFALNNDVVMMNDRARSAFSPADQASVLRHAAEGIAARREAVTVDLPTGMRVRMQTRLVRSAGRIAGGVVDVKVVEQAGLSVDDGAARMLLPGLIGTGAVWRRACGDVEQAYRSGEWLALEGEAGVGKLALVRAVHQRLNPAGRLVVVDGAQTADRQWLTQARQALAADENVVVLRHLDALDRPSLRALATAVQDASSRPGLWVAVMVREGTTGEEFDRLMGAFPSSVVVPPLRHHVEDVQQLVPFLLGRLGCGGHLTFSPQAMQVLMRSSWPGNVEQLLSVLRKVVQGRRTGVVEAADLPPETGSLSRRRLSPLESMERDAIVHGLLDAGGSKAEAARALGMSRATIYRKIHEYGIAASPAEMRRGWTNVLSSEGDLVPRHQP